MPDWSQHVRPHLASLKIDAAREAEIIDELSQHLDQRYEELRGEGVADAEAQRLVAKELREPTGLASHMESLKQAHAPAPVTPSAPGDGWLRGSWRDLRVAMRSLRKAPWFAASAILTLALAIGANTSIFSVVNTVLLDPLAFPDADQLVAIRASAPGSEINGEFGPGAEFFVEYKQNARTLQDLAHFQTAQTTVSADQNVDRLFIAAVSPSLYSTLRVEPLIGRLPTEQDPEGTVMVMSHWLWTTWFNSDPSVLGRAVQVSGAPRTVIGVMRPDFQFPSERTSVWIHDLVTEPVRPGGFGLGLVGRMAPGATHESLRTELAALAQRLPERFGSTPVYARIIAAHQPIVRSLEETLVGNLKDPLWILLGTAGIVLLIACANVANLFLVRAESRRRDLAVRRALGAGRAVLIRSQMAESFLLATFGAAGGVLLAWFGVPLIVQAAPENVPRLASAGIDGTALLFTAGVALIAALASGLLPAIRFSVVEITSGLRSSRQSGSTSGRLTRDTLVVVQTAAAFVLLVASALLFQSFRELRSVDPGFETADIFTFQMAPNPRELGIVDGPGAAQFHYGFLDRVAALPGVQSVGLVDTLPLDEGAANVRFATERTEAGGALLRATYADRDYFKTMGISLLSGSYFTRDTAPAAVPGVIISKSAAETLWPGENPLGQRLRHTGAPSPSEGWLTVIGVVEDVMLANFREEQPNPMVYMPLVGYTPRAWIVGTPAYVVKTARAETIGNEIRELIRQIAPTAPMYRIFTMDGLAARSMAGLSFTALSLGIAAVLALVLGCIGIYGTLSYMVSQRASEIGIRMALGAQTGQVRRMIVGHGSRVALIGVAIGIIGALGLTRLLSSLLFRVTALDVATFLAISAMMIGVALLASYVPARRASRVDPMIALRSE